MHTEDLQIQEASSSDLSGIVLLERYLFPPELQFGRRRWHYLLTQAKGYCWVLKNATGKVYGYLCALEQRQWRQITLHTLGIHWQAQGFGWGKLLVEQLLTEARTRQYRRVRLEVAELNLAARALYDQFGFTLIAELENYYGQDQTGLRMEHQLS